MYYVFAKYAREKCKFCITFLQGQRGKVPPSSMNVRTPTMNVRTPTMDVRSSAMAELSHAGLSEISYERVELLSKYL
jgi:hypothetical protein